MSGVCFFEVGAFLTRLFVKSALSADFPAIQCYSFNPLLILGDLGFQIA
jgi:hypothetical protein